jgi:hypothetical protein
MIGLGLAPIVHTGFALTPNLAHDVLTVKFTGNGDMAAVAPLASFLKQTHREATHLGVKEVRFDLLELYFMNSSCFKSFVTWIDAVSHAGSQGYRIRFIANPKQHWQRRSLDALRRLADNVVTIES